MHDEKRAPGRNATSGPPAVHNRTFMQDVCAFPARLLRPDGALRGE